MTRATDLVELQETLYTSGNPTRRWLHCSRRDWVVEAIQQWSKLGNTRALEVGPGSGLYLPVLAAHFREVVASDIEEAYLSHARGLMVLHPNLSLVVDDITVTRLEVGTFDLVLCTEVLEHVRESDAALRGMARLLRPGGTLILTTPQRYCLLELGAKIAFLPGIVTLVRRVYREPILEMGHINLMTEREVVRQIEAAGFTVVERFKSGLYLPLVAEFMGGLGLRFERFLEVRVRRGLFDWLLWTQYYIARRTEGSA